MGQVIYSLASLASFSHSVRRLRSFTTSSYTTHRLVISLRRWLENPLVMALAEICSGSVGARDDLPISVCTRCNRLHKQIQLFFRPYLILAAASDR